MDERTQFLILAAGSHYDSKVCSVCSKPRSFPRCHSVRHLPPIPGSSSKGKINFSLKIRITIKTHLLCRWRRRAVCNWTGPMSPEPKGFFYLVLIRRTMRSCQSLAVLFIWWTFFPEDLLGSALGFGFWLQGVEGGVTWLSSCWFSLLWFMRAMSW